MVKYSEVSLRYVDPRQLTVAQTNNRTVPINDKSKEMLRASIRKSGVIEPLLINSKMQIVSGQLRWMESIAAGLNVVPVVVGEFGSEFEERIASIAQDFIHHPLEESDRKTFCKNCIEKDGKTMEEIADALGVTVQTIRNWCRWQAVPEVIADNEEAKELLAKLPNKKQKVVQSILVNPTYRNDTEAALGIIEYSRGASLRELESARKDVVAGNIVDTGFRKSIRDQNTSLLEIKIPRTLDKAFRDKLKAKKEDYHTVMVRLITEYVRSL